MMLMSWTIWILLSALLATSPIDVETYSFEIHKGNKLVGELTGIKKTFEDRVIYSSHSETTIYLLFKIEVLYDYQVEYRKGKLYQSDVKIIVNDDLHRQTKIRSNGNHFIFTKYKKKREDTTLLEFPVEYSSILLLFHEPISEQASFSEEEGVFHPLSNIGNHVYEKTNSKGRINKYVYSEGLLDKVFMDAGFFKFQLIRKNT